MNANCPRLIEVALPIREISAESVRDKNIHQSHIRNLHVWWARRPLAACRAIVFASLIPDPDNPSCPPEFRLAVQRLLKENVPPELRFYRRGRNSIIDNDPYHPYEGYPDTLRNRLLMFIAKWSPEQILFNQGKSNNNPQPSQLLDDRCLIKWETVNPSNEQGKVVISIAQELIKIANNNVKPVVLDPFGGGGSIPLEASRLGSKPITNDYNPVAHTILRATCEFPQKFGFAGDRYEIPSGTLSTLPSLTRVSNTLVYDVENWAKKILENAQEKIGNVYPPKKNGHPIVGYLWARTVPCSNPACKCQIPLLHNLLLCDKPGKKIALSPSVEGGKIKFKIVKGAQISETEGTISNGVARCLICGQVTPVEDIKRASFEGVLGNRIVAVIVDGTSGKDYYPSDIEDENCYQEAVKMSQGIDRPNELMPSSSDTVSGRGWNFKKWGDLFNDRQLLTLNTLKESFNEISNEIDKSNVGANEYKNAILTYLGLWISRIASFNSTFCIWAVTSEIIKNPFGRQALPMNFDYPESNPFSESSGSALTQLKYLVDVIRQETNINSYEPSEVFYGSADSLPLQNQSCSIVVTDPPYFDAIAYADLSDFYYVWLKRVLGNTLPEVFSTPLTPKNGEVTALKHRHGGSAEKANNHFVDSLKKCLIEAKRVCHDDGLFAIMFAHQSTEAWAALIDALFSAGLSVNATFPIDTELTTALKKNVSALSSSITVICRSRIANEIQTLKSIRVEIDKAVKDSVKRFWDLGFRGADLIVACYGPAVGIFGKYERVERADGTIVTIPELLNIVRESALKAIAGEFTGDSLSRLYFVWANLYGISEQSWDDARLVIQIGTENDDPFEVVRKSNLFVVKGQTCHLALLRDRSDHRHLGEDATSPLIDQLHQAMLLWKQERRSELVQYLKTNNIAEHEPFWKLAQALFEVLPRGEEDWKLISALLGERETLKQEVRQAEPPKGPEQLSLI